MDMCGCGYVYYAVNLHVTLICRHVSIIVPTSILRVVDIVMFLTCYIILIMHVPYWNLQMLIQEVFKDCKIEQPESYVQILI